ncbi:MAG: efflux RND transporter periplasmic adaptor subunit [Myxococcales bacterium]|nr:efflux RND transporter periplasmic adaptor subunit [Myxococcales bacterium]
MKERARIYLSMSLVLAGCEKPEEQQAKPIIRPVRYVVVASPDTNLHRTFSGAVKAGSESRLSFRVPGRISKVHAKVGTRLKPGQMIAQLDPTDFQLQLQEARAAIARSQAQTRAAAASYKRVRALYANQNATRQELDSARAQAESAEAAGASMEQNVRLLQRQLAYATLNAPSAGTISRVEVEAGENVAPGQVVAVLQVGEQLEVEVAVPESTISRIEPGSRVQVTVKALSGKSLEGTVTEVGVASAQAAVYPVTVVLKGAVQDVRAGMAADVRFAFKSVRSPEVRLLPPAAVGEDREGRFVYVVEPAKRDGSKGLGTIQRRAVEVGEISAAGLEIERGLKDGERVVTAGVGRIHDGLTVKLPAPPSDSEAQDQGEHVRGPDETNGPDSENAAGADR